MSSYAAVAKENIPAGDMPEPSQDLRDGSGVVLPAPGADKDKTDTPVDDGKTWEERKDEAEKALKDGVARAEKRGREFEKKARAELDRAETALEAYWAKAQDVLFRPATMGGLMGLVNVGLLGGLGYVAYENRNRPWDQRWVAGAVGGTLALFTTQGYLAESYLETPEGRAEAERAKREGSKLYLQAKEVLLRPNVAGGLAGFFNVIVLGTVGFFAHKHWNEPWDRKIVTGVGAGLLALSGLEGWLGVEYADKELPKH